ncbi:outer membrane beta-barrel protein [Alcanivorax sp. S6407]|uniref:outer membrane protein n=1 Tax=Alcanivorax sp. S6407 TaxID=2926424 RepID=UPI001FF16245|nr:outer membrane beta-barrel protein [Alcanivorax sp. S6407]MCK0155006.1 outer membrane beta-barrel protein [Alcanivorax sp. S6407]
MKKNVFSVLLFLAIPAQLLAEIPNSYRAERWEGSIRVIGLQGQKVTGERGSSVDITDDVGFGFDMAYNHDEHLALGFAMEWVETDFRTDTTSDANGSFDGRGELEMTTMNLHGTWHFFDKALTPYVHGALGATYLDTNVATGPSVPVCWYDPWWGYYCGLSTPTLSDTVFSYEAGAGLRLDIDDSTFVRAGYSQQWLDVGRGVDTVDQGLWRFGIGMVFN